MATAPVDALHFIRSRLRRYHLSYLGKGIHTYIRMCSEKAAVIADAFFSDSSNVNLLLIIIVNETIRSIQSTEIKERLKVI